MKKAAGGIIRATTSLLLALSALTGVVCSTTRSVNAARDSYNVENYYSDRDVVHYKSVYGGKIDLVIDGSQIGLDTDCARNISFKIKAENGNLILRETHRGSFMTEAAESLEVNKIYYVDMTYTADGIEQREYDAYLTLKEDGNLSFIDSPLYEFNLERCSELWTDEQSLQECLQPQNDIECDNPIIIQYAESVTEGCTNDWEKSFAIYKYIIENFAYDNVQLYDYSMAYQDDALSLIRRQIAICEGLGNVYVAMCRAVGVPAVVSFGLGEDEDTVIHGTDILTNEDPNHAWAMVCLDGEWYSVDPTWEGTDEYNGDSFYTGTYEEYDPTYDWYLIPLEIFSFSHKICDADTIHGIESSGKCGDHATYEISRDGTITISGYGELNLPYGVNGFSKVVFAPDSNITSIGESCFEDCDIIERIILPDTVTSIGDYAFFTCEDLEYVYIPEGVTYIGEQAFDCCDELTYVRVPDSVTSVGPYAFDDCSRLIISVPNGLNINTNAYDVSPASVIVRGR